MRFSRPLLVLLLLPWAGRLSADEHIYSAFVSGAYAHSSGSGGLHVVYEDTTKRPPFVFPRKNHWSAVLDVSVQQDGPENQYILLGGGRGSWKLDLDPYVVCSAQLTAGYIWVSGSEQRVRAEALGELPRDDGALVSAGIGFDYLLGEKLTKESPTREKHVEDGPRV